MAAHCFDNRACHLTPSPPIKRIQENLLAAQERRLLNWICPRLPAWTTPDQLTLLALFAAVLVFAGYSASSLDANWLWLSVGGYVLHWFGDSLDGSLARFRGIQRPRYGYFIDHSADVLGALFIVGGVGASPYVRFDVSLVALAGYYMLAAHAFLAARVIDELRLSHVAAGPTELRLILIGLTVAMFFFGQPAKAGSSIFSWFDLFVGAFGAVLIMLFIVQTLVMARRLARLDE
jgi:phosphatidylglycerophosphate synthase